MVDLALLQSVSYIAGALGVCVAAFYYVMTLKVQQTSMKANLETRQAQFMNQISENITSLESQRSLIHALSIQWTDWEDFSKRWDGAVNPESAHMRLSIMKKFENIGWLLKKGLLDPDWCYSQFHADATPLWVKYEQYVLTQREKYNSPTVFIGFEYLGRKFMEIEEEKGINPNLDEFKNPSVKA